MSDGKLAEYLVDKLFKHGSKAFWNGAEFHFDETRRITFSVKDPSGREYPAGSMSREPLVRFFKQVIEEYNDVER